MKEYDSMTVCRYVGYINIQVKIDVIAYSYILTLLYIYMIDRATATRLNFGSP